MNMMAIVEEFGIGGTIHEGIWDLVSDVDMGRSCSACRTVSEVDCNMAIAGHITTLNFGSAMRYCTASEQLVSTYTWDG